MLRVLFIEKPDMAEKVARALHEGKESIGARKNGYFAIKYLGENAYVTWGYGHMCGLMQAKDYNEEYKSWQKLPVPFIPEPYKTKVLEGKEEQMKIIKKLFDRADLIMNGTDADREGNLIFYYIYQKLGCKKPFVRIWNQEATEEGIRKSFASPLDAKKDDWLTQAGKARSVADWVIGSNLTVAMTLKFASSKQLLSIGRVQTPTLKLFVDREKAIRDFKPSKFFVPVGTFVTLRGETYKGEPSKKFEKKSDIPTYPDKGVITEVKKEATKKGAPHLYSLSALQMAANARYGITVQETLDIAQKLYEKGYTTYPRTDSQYLNEDMVDKVNEILGKLARSNPDYKTLLTGRKPVTKTKYHFDDKKVTGHYAIIPTGNTPSGLDEKSQQVYDLVCRSLIIMTYGPAELEKTTVTTKVGDTDFITHGNIIIKPEWLTVMGMPKEKIVPKVEEGEEVSAKFEIAERETKPPTPYDDASIIKAMITCGKDIKNDELREILSRTGMQGIGRESTRAAIISTLLARGYIERKGKQLRATDMGIALIDTIPIEDIKSAVMTAEWEQRLDKVAEGEDSYDKFVKDIEETLKKWCGEVNTVSGSSIIAASSGESLGKCPKCGMPVLERKWGYSCSGWKKDGTGCDFGIANKIASKKLTATQIKKLLASGETGLIKGFTGKSGKKFDAKLKFDETHKLVFAFDNKKK